MVFLPGRSEGCEAIDALLGSGLRPSVLDFLDAETLALLAGSFPGEVPPRAGFALIVEVDGSLTEAQAQREEVAGGARREGGGGGGAAGAGAVALARGGQRGADGSAGHEGERGRGLPASSAWRRVWSASRRWRERAGCARARWDTAARATCTRRCWSTRPTRSSWRPREALGEELFALVVELGGSVAGEHGVGWLKRGRLEAQWDARGRCELHEQIKQVFDPKGLLNPGKKLAR